MLQRILFCTTLSLIMLAAPLSAAPVALDGYAASVNGEIITIGDVLKTIEPMQQQLQTRFKGQALAKKVRELFESGLNAQIERKLILAEFTEAGGSIPDRLADERVNEIIEDRFQGNRAAFLQTLREQGLSLAEWREQVKEEMVVSFSRQQNVYHRTAISPKKVKALYDSRLDSFSTSSRVHLQLIVFKIWVDDQQFQEKLQLAYKLRFSLLSGEATFGELALKYSEGSKADAEGDNGWLEVDTLRSELATAIKSLKIGQVSDVVRTDKEIYLARVIDRQSAEVTPLTEKYEELKAELTSAQEEELYEAWIKRLRQKYPVKIIK